MKSFYLTDTGRVRSHNEDSVTIVKNASGEHLMIVADGMGGHFRNFIMIALQQNQMINIFLTKVCESRHQ